MIATSQQQGEPVASGGGQRRSFIDHPSDVLGELLFAQVEFGVDQVGVVGLTGARECSDSGARVCQRHGKPPGRTQGPLLGG